MLAGKSQDRLTGEGTYYILIRLNSGKAGPAGCMIELSIEKMIRISGRFGGFRPS